MTNTSNPRLGSTLDSLLEADGTLAEAEAAASSVSWPGRSVRRWPTHA